MKISVPLEKAVTENRTALIPDDVRKLIAIGFKVEVESGLGMHCYYCDEDYLEAGASVSNDRDRLLNTADLVVRIQKPRIEEIALLKEDAIHISFLNPFIEKDLIETFKAHKISSISLELIPRTTVAQKMDVLSSQASLAGYAAVIVAAHSLNKAFPMMMTAAGTIKPVRALVIGAGVAGLQAIATAKRLGAIVSAFDTRAAVEEQINSLGAKFIKIVIGKTEQTSQGYAKALTDEQAQIQRQALAKHCANSDIVITTAQVFGKRAPLIVTKEMVEGMRAGSVIVDLAVDTGGNVEGSKRDEEVNLKGVKIIGITNLAGRVAVHASQVFSQNLFNLIVHIWDKQARNFTIDTNDEILKSCPDCYIDMIIFYFGFFYF
ncbi:nicotinamide nucleotide transhydrogenase, subunit alpha1, partial [Candidatus Magnetoovum chiemensis]